MVRFKDNTIIVKDLKEKKYYEIPENGFRLISNEQWIHLEKHHSLKCFVLYMLMLSIHVAFNVYIFLYPKSQIRFDVKSLLFCMAIYFPIFVVGHELGHLVTLKILGKNADKIGIKLNYIFPSIYIRMNDVYLLDKIEKIYTHSAGIFVSLILNNTLFCIALYNNIEFLQVTTLFLSGDIIWNMVPILNSDGYKVLLSLMGKNEMKDKSKNSMIVKIGRIFNLFVVIVYIVEFVNSFK